MTIVHTRAPKRRREDPNPDRFDPEFDAEFRAWVAKNMRPLPRD